jgi:predicted NAD-dependent protein-ADP-ribosyltransferase YbiA (DUF1768 family)
MKVLLQHRVAVLIPESEDERATLENWRACHDDFVFGVNAAGSKGVALIALGPHAQACREPINVTSMSPQPIRLIANFAPTPFELDGLRYACVEAFWQSLRFPIEERARIAAMDGAAAKQASAEQPYGSHVIYAGKAVSVGTWDHWQLMRRACRAKFDQNEEARLALLATGGRPLIHKVRRDSRTIPGVIMAEIWMALRESLVRSRAQAPKPKRNGS